MRRRSRWNRASATAREVASGPWAVVVLAVVFLVGIATGVAVVRPDRGSSSPPVGKPVGAPGSPQAADLPAPSDLPTTQEPQLPVGMSVEIPSIGVQSELIGLHIQPDNSLGVPADFGVAGLWTEGAAPGTPGPAIVVGHVNSVNGPAVFARLHDLQPGASVVIRKADGSALTYAVERSDQYAKSSFPTAVVYGATAAPTLRLITCGGTFDRTRREYTDNVVVFAHLVT